MRWVFKEEKSFEERSQESVKILKRYPNRVPVIIEKRPESTLEMITNKKFLVEDNSTAAQFLYTIRKRIPEVQSTEAVFLFVNKDSVILTSTMKDLYTKYKDKDNFLYISYSNENVFGTYSDVNLDKI